MKERGREERREGGREAEAVTAAEEEGEEVYWRPVARPWRWTGGEVGGRGEAAVAETVTSVPLCEEEWQNCVRSGVK